MISRILTILAGMALIAVLTPLSQFLTIGALNSTAETAVPNAWALGIIFSLMLVLLVVRLIRKIPISRANVVILYAMLTIAVPLMNLGLIRQAYLAMTSVFTEYFYFGTSTYRTAYNATEPTWFPLIPDRDGLAWNRAARLIRLFQDEALARQKRDAAREVTRAITDLSKTPDATLPPNLSELINQLGVPEIDSIRGQFDSATLESVGVAEALANARTTALQSSAEALEQLPALLASTDEFVASLLPKNRSALDYSGRSRLDAELNRLSNDQRSEILARVAALDQKSAQIFQLVGQLTPTDASILLEKLSDQERDAYKNLSGEQIDVIRESFVYRLSREERSDLMSQDGGGEPNQNLSGFRQSIWTGIAGQQKRERQTLSENLRDVWNAIPWDIWARPILQWSTLFIAIFLLLMCVAEWFRRKWVDRENLAFPLVEVADNIIRHDSRLETADDVRTPEPRKRIFNPLFLIGFALGFFILSLEALGHYGITSSPAIMVFDVTKQLFTEGALKELQKIVFVVSPIVVGLLFLVNLEISFSVWVIFLIVQITFWLIKGSRDIRDSLFTGWGGGTLYPFFMEQFIGACFCFSAVLVIKSFVSSKKSGQTVATTTGHFVPNRLMLAGFIVLPVLIVAMLWSIGVTNVPLLCLAAIVLAAQTIAMARARAETGLPASHVSYEFTKLPMVLGMTGSTGANVFVSFLSITFLPVTLLFPTFSQHLENMELARRIGVKYRSLAVAALLAFLTALVVGMISFLVMAYYIGEQFIGATLLAPHGNQNSPAISSYPLWIAHFFGENGLTAFTQVHWIRIWFVVIGFAIFGLLLFLRQRFLKFPLHPMGYLLLVASIWFEFISPYFRGVPQGEHKDTSWLWGSAFIAWLLKTLIVKYGGMNTYKRAKPFFIGLVVGSVICVFVWNFSDLIASLALAGESSPSGILRGFIEKNPFTPYYY